jgi:hypothetical protein
MKVPEQERRDWIMIPLILGIGFLCVIIAGQWALRFSPSWKLNANMDSNLDPNRDFLTHRPGGFIEPVDPSILTQPVWINLFLTPGAQFPTGTLNPITAGTSFSTSASTQMPFKTSTPISIPSATNTNAAIASPTNTFVYYPPTSTSRPKPTATSAVSPIYTSTPTAAVTSSWTSTPTPTQSPTGISTPSFTPASTFTSTATQTPTNTPDPSEPDFGIPDGNTTTLGNGAWVEFNLSGFLLDGNSAWDAVYYEMEETSSAGKIHLGAMKIEVYDQTTATWFTIYYWGDNSADPNASYDRNGNLEPDGFPVDMSALYGAPPFNTGIAIDIDSVLIGQPGVSIGDLITQIRITSLSNTKCDVDSLQMLR